LAKAALAAAVPLAHLASNAELSLATDASDTHVVGGVLQQLNGGRWQPLAFFSKKLSGAGTRYSTFDRKLLAAFSVIRHFRFLLEGRQFRLLTDHKPLVTSLFHTTPPWSARQQRQLSFIAEFTSDIRHTPGQENVVADALSRPPPATAQPPPPSQQPSPTLAAEDWPEEGLAAPERPNAQPINFSAMAAAQQACPEVPEMMNSTTLQITTQVVGDETLLETLRQGSFAHLYPSNIGRRFSSRCTLYTTRECGRPAASSPPGSAGHRWPRPLLRWPGLAYTASGARFTDAYTYSQPRYRYLTAVSPTSTST
jgi:hypothetical protein